MTVAAVMIVPLAVLAPRRGGLPRCFGLIPDVGSESWQDFDHAGVESPYVW